jgi:NTE family protein
MTMKNINLVLSGGGARGIAHAGAIKALYEFGFTIKALSGVSAGAIIGAMIAKGYSPQEILDSALADEIFRSWKPPFKLGMLKKKRLYQMLQKYFPADSFSELSVPMVVSATNINTAQTDFFSSGELIKPLLASSAVPLLFSPVEINGFQYLDGGMLNNLPVEPFSEDKNPLVGIHVNPIINRAHIASTYKVVERSLELSAFKNVQWRKKLCMLILEPAELSSFAVYEFDRMQDIFNIGYESAGKALEETLAADNCFTKALEEKSAA